MGILDIFQLHAPLKHKAKQIKTRNGSNVQRDLDRLNRLYAVTNGTDPAVQVFSTGEYEKVVDTELYVFAQLNGLVCHWYLNLEYVDTQEVKAILFFDKKPIIESSCSVIANAGQKVYLSGMFEYFGPENNYHTLEIMVKTEKDKTAKTIGLNRGLTCQEKDIVVLTDIPQDFGWRL